MKLEQVAFDMAQVAQRIALRGATEYLNAHKLTASNEALSACVHSWVKIKFPEAMEDARQAIDCGMVQVAQTTFAATLIQAGIEAAKECGMPA